MTKSEYDNLPDDAFISSDELVPVILEDIKRIKYPRRDLNGKGCSELYYQVMVAPLLNK